MVTGTNITEYCLRMTYIHRHRSIRHLSHKSLTRLQSTDLTPKFLWLFAVLPRIVPFSFETPLFAGQATQVTCLVSEGDQPLDIQWYFEGQSLKEKPTVSATKIGQRASLLLIDPAGWSNSGTYTCLARNAAGFSNYTASLEVHGIICIPSTNELCIPF